MRYELTDFEWTAIRPFLPNKPRGVPRVNDRRVLNDLLDNVSVTAVQPRYLPSSPRGMRMELPATPTGIYAPVLI